MTDHHEFKARTRPMSLCTPRPPRKPPLPATSALTAAPFTDAAAVETVKFRDF